ncbi:MAG: hypothetical protein JSU86_20220 [Phycisphaerales bacterium]|nr:MAG: hypothetical protein JSU86_20220 [Phycisphaerales bacterium]
MAPEDTPTSDRAGSRPQPDDLPAIEDAYSPDESPEQVVDEDDLQLLDPAIRALEGDDADEVLATPSTEAAAPADSNDTSDTDAIVAEPEAPAETTETPKPPNWACEVSAHKIVVELKRVEAEVRKLLEGRDPKRKRKLGGTRRWLELEEDILSWRYGGRIDEDTLRRLQDLITRRHHLFRRLRFLAGTRPTWNT